MWPNMEHDQPSAEERRKGTHPRSWAQSQRRLQRSWRKKLCRVVGSECLVWADGRPLSVPRLLYTTSDPSPHSDTTHIR
jgi:hypothetical protein